MIKMRILGLLIAFVGLVIAIGSIAHTLRYTGRHRARRGHSDAQRAMRSASYVEARRWIDELTVPLELVPAAAYDHHLGAGRYVHLRIDELRDTFERETRLAELGLIKPRSPWDTEEWADEWTEELTGVAT